jgi:hypothetical protein
MQTTSVDVDEVSSTEKPTMAPVIDDGDIKSTEIPMRSSTVTITSVSDMEGISTSTTQAEIVSTKKPDTTISNIIEDSGTDHPTTTVSSIQESSTGDSEEGMESTELPESSSSVPIASVPDVESTSSSTTQAEISSTESPDSTISNFIEDSGTKLPSIEESSNSVTEEDTKPTELPETSSLTPDIISPVSEGSSTSSSPLEASSTEMKDTTISSGGQEPELVTTSLPSMIPDSTSLAPEETDDGVSSTDTSEKVTTTLIPTEEVDTTLPPLVIEIQTSDPQVTESTDTSTQVLAEGEIVPATLSTTEGTEVGVTEGSGVSASSEQPEILIATTTLESTSVLVEEVSSSIVSALDEETESIPEIQDTSPVPVIDGQETTSDILPDSNTEEEEEKPTEDHSEPAMTTVTPLVHTT